MAVLTVTTLTRAGFNLSDNDVSAAGGGDSFPNTGYEAVYFLNGSVGDITVTFTVQTTTDGLAVTNKTAVVSAGEAVIAGPWPTHIYNDANGRVQMTYSGVTSLTVAVFKLIPA